MCDIFPEVDNCCYILTLRVAMLFIAVLSITTGCATLASVEKVADANQQLATQAAMELINAKDLEEIKKALLSNLSINILNAIFIMACLFMFCGVILLIANLTDQEGLVQIFVWVEFLNVVIGLVILVLVAFECMTKDKCLLDIDWLSSAFALVAWFFYMMLWVYFISVANSYVLNGDT